MKNSALVKYLENEAAKFTAKASAHAMRALHGSPDGRSINELDARLIRDHEIRAETYKTSATIARGHHA